MTAHLLLISLGPVQEFIAQSRRTRDLWYGSHLISELARATARILAKNGAQLIFPPLNVDDPELSTCLSPLRSSGKPPISISNKLLAEIPDGKDPETLARLARGELNRFWTEEITCPVKSRCRSLLAPGTDGVWDEQIGSFLEFAATWTPLETDYRIARDAVEKSIAGRKTLRDFQPFHKQRGGVPKSSLDGARESVLRRLSDADAGLVSKYRITKGEQLDALGLVKRAGGNPDQFVPIVNIALSSWISLIARNAPNRLDSLRSACDNLGLSRVRGDLPCTKLFRYDAEIFLPGRWKSVFEQQKLSGNPQTWGREHIAPILRDFGEPVPYVACLLADGDRVGALLSSVKSADEHRRFSRSMSGFAEKARDTVEQEHSGVLIYAGGDDVLAFLPLPEALVCADKLRQNFSAVMAETGFPGSDLPTLSVGVGVGHIIESMGDLLELGREAEKLAKNGTGNAQKRNALAVVIEKRSGSRRCWRARWDECQGSPVARLLKDAELIGVKLSARKVYEIEKTLKRLPYPGDKNVAESPSWARLLALEVQYCLVNSGEGADLGALGISLNQQDDYSRLYYEISAWVDRMIVSRTFAASVPHIRHLEAKL